MFYGNNPYTYMTGDLFRNYPAFGAPTGQGGVNPAFSYQPSMWNQPMSFASPWNFSAGFTSPWNPVQALGAPWNPIHGLGYGAPFHQTSQPHGALWNETHLLSQKLDFVHQQIAYLTELAHRNSMMISSLLTGMGAYGHPMLRTPAQFSPWTAGVGAPQGMVPPFPGIQGGSQGLTSGNAGAIGLSYEMSPIRIRETESYLCWEIPFQGLTLSDVEVEVIGNRIVCRTRNAIPPMQRFWNWSILPNGIQVFELPDGRVECSCFVPVAFDAKEVEAVFKESGIAIYVPKSGAAERQNVRVGKDAPQYVTGGSSSRKNITASQHS